MTGDRSLSRAICFASVGTLRIDNSVKYMAQTFTALVHRPSFTQIRQWTDARDDVDLFSDEA